MIPIPYVHGVMGLICLLAALPLILRRVPANRYFGIRTHKACASSENWYALNAYGGWWLLAFGAWLVGFTFFLQETAPSPRSALAPLFLVVPLLPGLLVAALVRRFDQGLP